MTLGKNLKINLFASEKEFPELAKPVQMQFDAKGRLWVAVWPSYPHWKPKEEMNDKILIFEDTDGDGKADKMTVFADHLHCPTGFEFYNGGVLVAQAPDLMFLKDTDGDGKADLRGRVLSGLDSADRTTRRTVSPSIRAAHLFPGRHLPPHAGRDALRTAPSAASTPASSAMSRARRSSRCTSPTASPTRTATSWIAGARISSSTAPGPIHITAPCSPATSTFRTSIRPPKVYQQRTRPCPGVEILSSRNFPKENQGNLLVANVIGFQGILQYKIDDKGSSFAGTEVEPISPPPIRISVPRTSRSAPTAPSGSSTGKIRSSAISSTPCATPAATAPMAASIAS